MSLTANQHLPHKHYSEASDKYPPQDIHGHPVLSKWHVPQRHGYPVPTTSDSFRFVEPGSLKYAQASITSTMKAPSAKPERTSFINASFWRNSSLYL